MGKVGGPRVFFDVLGTFNATRLLADGKAQTAVLEAVVLDSVDSIVQSFAGIGQMIGQITSEVVPLGVALSEATLEFEKFAGRGTEQLQESIMKTGVSFGLAADESLRAGAKMAQLSALIGKDTIDVATELGQKFALIGGMSTEEAMKGLINLQQQTRFMYGDMEAGEFRYLTAQNQRATVVGNTMEMMDQLNTVENTSVATMKQLIFVMNQFAAQAHLTGESISDMAAMSAVLIEAGEEQGKAGRALRMIYARLGSNIKDNNDLMKSYGVNTHDANGALRSLSDILADLSKVYPEMTEQQRQNLVQTVAGNDHYVRFVKLIENQARVAELATGAMENQATAQSEVNLRLDDASIAYKSVLEDQKLIKAELGRALLPAMTEAAQRTNNMTQAFSELAQTGLGGKLASLLIQFQTYGQVFGGFINAFMQMKSINIAMATHETILKAINGEEIVRTDNYRKQGLFSGVTLEHQKEYHILLQDISIQESILGAHTERRDGIQQDINFYLEEEILLKKQITANEAELMSLKAQGSYSATAEYNAKLQAYTLEQKIRQEMIANAIGSRALAQGRHAHLRALLPFIEMHHAAEQRLSDQRNIRIAGHNISMSAMTGENAVHMASIRLTSEELKELKKSEKAHIENAIARQEQIATIRAGMGAEQQRNADLERANLLMQQNEFAVRELSLTQDQLANFTQEMTMALIAYNDALDQNNLALIRKSRMDLKGLLTQQAANRGVKEGTVLIDRMRYTTTKFSMAAGMASMALGFFGDDLDSSKASMVLMTASMVPAVFQMGLMASQMGKVGVMGQVGAQGMTKMAMAGSLVGSLGLAAGLGLVAYGITKLMSNSDDATDSIDVMNQSLKTTSDLLSSLSFEDAKSFEVPATLAENLGSTLDITAMSMDQLSHAIGVTEGKMNKLRESQKVYSSDEPMFSRIQDEINALDNFAETLNQKRIIDIGSDVLSLEFDYPADEGMAQAGHIMRLFEQDIQGNLDTGLEFELGKQVTFNAGTYIGDRGVNTGVFTEIGTTSRKDFIKAFGDEFDLNFDDLMDIDAYSGEDRDFGGNKLRSGLSKAQRTVLGNNITLQDIATMTGLTYEEVYEKMGKDTIVFSNTAKTAYGRIFHSMNELGTGFEFMKAPLDDLTDSIGDGFTDAEEKMRGFANAREELFFGGKSSYMSGDMMKQVVNKGVENLYSNVELVMTNNFYGLTFEQATAAISQSIVRDLIDMGVPMSNTTV